MLQYCDMRPPQRRRRRLTILRPQPQPFPPHSHRFGGKILIWRPLPFGGKFEFGVRHPFGGKFEENRFLLRLGPGKPIFT